MNEQQLRNHIKQILSEKSKDEKDEPKKKKKKSSKAQPGDIVLSTGKGAFKKMVGEAGALAEKQPKELMKNLGITSGGSDLQGAINIMKQTLKSDTAMSKAYGGLKVVNQGGKQGLKVTMGELDARNGAKFIHHTLIGAKNAGKYKLAVPLQIQVSEGGVVIYVSEKKGSWGAQ